MNRYTAIARESAEIVVVLCAWTAIGIGWMLGINWITAAEIPPAVTATVGVLAGLSGTAVTAAALGGGE